MESSVVAKNFNKLFIAAAVAACTAWMPAANAETVMWEGQSPIDIPAASLTLSKNFNKISVHYSKETIKLVNTYVEGGSIDREWGALKAQPLSGPAFNSYIMVDGEKYVLAQFHFHTPSEHTLNAQAAPAEIHFVHLRVHDNGDPYCVGEPQSLLVIGAFINANNRTTRGEMAKIFANGTLPARNADASVQIADFNLSKLMPSVTYSYRYNGSLTAPSAVDCTKDVFSNETAIYNTHNTVYNSDKTHQLDAEVFPEAVSWVVLKAPMTISEEDLQKLETAMGENSRPVQPRNNRAIKFVP